MKSIKSISVSVIIPVYNAEDYLDECLQSIIYQTLEEIEMICVDDGSNDNSSSILKDYAVKDSRIIVLNQANHGAGAARNNGLKRAKGEFVAFMDADDYYPNKRVLHKLYTKAVDNNALICGGSMSSVNVTGRYINTKYKGNFAKNSFSKEGKFKYSDYQFDYSYHRFIYNREFLLKNNIFFPNYRRFQDPPFFVKAMISAGEFYAVNYVTYRYRVRNQKINWNEEKIIGLINGLNDIFSMSKEHKLSELQRLCFDRFINEYFHHIIKYPTRGVYKNLLRMMDSIEPDFVEADHYDQLNQYLSGKFYYPLYSIIENATHKKICILGIRLNLRKDIAFAQQIFSIRDEEEYKVLRFFGIKIKFKRRNKNA